MKMGRQKSKNELDTYLSYSTINKASMNSEDAIIENQNSVETPESDVDEENEMEEDKIIIKDNTYIIKGKEGKAASKSSKTRRPRKGGNESNSNVRQRLYERLSCKLRERNKKGKVVRKDASSKQKRSFPTSQTKERNSKMLEIDSETESSSTYSDTDSDSESESDSELEEKPYSKFRDSFLSGPIRVIDGKVITGNGNSIPPPPYVQKSRGNAMRCNGNGSVVGAPAVTGVAPPVNTNMPPVHLSVPPKVDVSVAPAASPYPQMFCNLSIPHVPAAPLTPVVPNTLQPEPLSSNYTLTNLNKSMNPHEGFKVGHVALPKGFSFVGAVVAPITHHVPVPNQTPSLIPAPVEKKKPMPLIPPLDKVKLEGGNKTANAKMMSPSNRMEYEDDSDSDSSSSSSSDEDDDTFTPSSKQEERFSSGESDERADSPASLVIDSDPDETWKPDKSKEIRRRRSLQMRSEKTLKKHASKPIKCEICLRGFDKPIRLRRHKQIYHARPFSCYVCNKQFKFEASLKEHKKMHGSAVTNIEMPDPPSVKRTMPKPLSPPPPLPLAPLPPNSHQTKEDKTEFSALLDCQFCCRKYDNKLALQKHLKARHGNRQYLCNICGRAFKFQASYKEHMNSHGFEKESLCVVCNRLFCDYGCNICGRRLGSPLDQSLHMAVHSDPTMLECKVCGKPFHEPKILQEHKKSHSGYVDCGCLVCWKCLDNRGVMKRHLVQVHTNDARHSFLDHMASADVVSR